MKIKYSVAIVIVGVLLLSIMPYIFVPEPETCCTRNLDIDYFIDIIVPLLYAVFCAFLIVVGVYSCFSKNDDLKEG